MNSTNKKKWIAGASVLGVLIGFIMMQIQGLMGWGFLITIASLVLVLVFRKQLEGVGAKPVEAKKEDVPKVGAGGWVGAIFVVLILIWGVSSITSMLFGSKESVVEAPKEYTDIDAYLFAERIIEKTLKAPSTADFAGYGGSTITRLQDGYKIVSYVDAENAFGAKLRSPWTVLIKVDGEQAEILLIVFDGKELYRSSEL